MQGENAAEADRERVRTLALEPLDEHRLEAAAERQVHRFPRLGAQALEHGQRQPPLVESRQDRPREVDQSEPGAIEPAARARLDEIHLLEGREHPVDGAARLGNLLGREVRAEDVAAAFVSLAMARKTTGAVLTVDGGNIAAAMR